MKLLNMLGCSMVLNDNLFKQKNEVLSVLVLDLLPTEVKMLISIHHLDANIVLFSTL